MGSTAYDEMVKRFLSDLVDGVVHRTHGYERSDIRAIVLAGGGTPSAFAWLGDISPDAGGTDVVRIARGIEPVDVMAYSAAAFARKALSSMYQPCIRQTRCQRITKNYKGLCLVEISCTYPGVHSFYHSHSSKRV
jgi:hypothetical protein